MRDFPWISDVNDSSTWMGRMLGPKPLFYTGLPLFRASSQNLDSHGSLGKRSYLPCSNPLFIQSSSSSWIEATEGRTVPDGRGIASETISTKPLLIWEREPICLNRLRGGVFYPKSTITSSCGSATDTNAGDREKESRVGLFSLLSPLQSFSLTVFVSSPIGLL